MAKKTAKAGRPPKPPGEKYKTTQRQFGRVDDETWAELQEAARKSDQSFTQWALAHLLRAARKKINSDSSPG